MNNIYHIQIKVQNLFYFYHFNAFSIKLSISVFELFG